MRLWTCVTAMTMRVIMSMMMMVVLSASGTYTG
jgi:hypothetical protein